MSGGQYRKHQSQRGKLELKMTKHEIMSPLAQMTARLSSSSMSGAAAARLRASSAIRALGLLGAMTLIAGCGSSAEEQGSEESAAEQQGAEQQAGEGSTAEQLSVRDAWVQSTDGEMAASGMVGGFASITNNGDEEVTITAAETEAAHSVELHEMSTGSDGQMLMRRIEGGLTIPAGSTRVLEPGGEHLMLMGVEELLAGDDIEIHLTLESQEQVSFSATIRDFSGANEAYGNE